MRHDKRLQALESVQPATVDAGRLWDEYMAALAELIDSTLWNGNPAQWVHWHGVIASGNITDDAISTLLELGWHSPALKARWIATDTAARRHADAIEAYLRQQGDDVNHGSQLPAYKGARFFATNESLLAAGYWLDCTADGVGVRQWLRTCAGSGAPACNVPDRQQRLSTTAQVEALAADGWLTVKAVQP